MPSYRDCFAISNAANKAAPAQGSRPGCSLGKIVRSNADPAAVAQDSGPVPATRKIATMPAMINPAPIGASAA
jgi:hypothetical protein